MSQKVREICMQQGARAFHAGQGDEACPYVPQHGKSAERIAWFDGYFEARIAKVLEPHGIPWP